jgi:hypothetical protein
MSDEADNVVSDLDYRIFAKNIVLASDAEDATEVYICANNGSVAVEAKENISLNCGDAYVRLSDDGLAIGSHVDGAIEIWQGSMPGSANLRLVGPASPGAALAVGVVGAGSFLAMAPDKLELANGPPVVGPSLKMSPTGLKLTFGLWSIEMSATGIDLVVATNKVSIQTTGISINGLTLDLVAMTKLGLQGLQINESASAQLTAAPSTVKML